MPIRNITVIGAGIVGIATASYLRRDGHAVTVVDPLPPGEYCSFGNAGILSPGSSLPTPLPRSFSRCCRPPRQPGGRGIARDLI